MKPQKKRAKKPDDLQMAKRYGHFGDPQVDNSAEEERVVRRRMAAQDPPNYAMLFQALETLDAEPIAASSPSLKPDLLAVALAVFEPKTDPKSEPKPAAAAVVVVTPAAGTVTWEFAGPLQRCINVIAFGGDAPIVETMVQQSKVFGQQLKALQDRLFARLESVFQPTAPKVAEFHRTLRKDEALRRQEAAAGPIAGKKYPDVCANSEAPIPVGSGYQVLTLHDPMTAAIAVPRPVADLLAVAHCVYHLIHYMHQAVAKSIADSKLSQPESLERIWDILCSGGNANVAQQPTSTWKYYSSPVFVQRIVQLRTTVETASGWLQ